mmetsp:Transcript_60473/g.197921  ORF Transcript_60473/g.197921 Transcript_60473/m.197921 type:complete len:191 (-) Transcript_60473:288-860(-)
MSADANLGTVGKVIEAVCIVLTTIGFITGVSWSSRYQTEGRSADEPQPGEGRRRVGGAGKDGKAALVKNVRLEAIAKAAIGAGRLPSISEGPLPKRPERTRSAAVTVPEVALALGGIETQQAAPALGGIGVAHDGVSQVVPGATGCDAFDGPTRSPFQGNGYKVQTQPDGTASLVLVDVEEHHGAADLWH